MQLLVPQRENGSQLQALEISRGALPCRIPTAAPLPSKSPWMPVDSQTGEAAHSPSDEPFITVHIISTPPFPRKSVKSSHLGGQGPLFNAFPVLVRSPETPYGDFYICLFYHV